MYGIVSMGQVMSSQPFRTFLCFFSPCAAGRERFHQGDPPFVANSVQCTCSFGEPQQVIKGDTVDGRNPAPVDMLDIASFTGFYTSQLMQDFFHQQYHYKWPYEILWMGNRGYNPTYRVTLSRSFFSLKLLIYRVIYVIYKGQQNTVSNVRVVDSSPNSAALGQWGVFSEALVCIFDKSEVMYVCKIIIWCKWNIYIYIIYTCSDGQLTTT